MPQRSTIRAVVYGRNSQGDEDSIESQLEEAYADSEAIGWPIVAEYQDEVSASRFTDKVRIDWPRLVADVETGRINGVIIRDTSRGDRRPARWMDFLDLCRDNNVLIRSVMKHKTYDCSDWDDYIALANQGLQSAGEAEQIRGRSLAGHSKGYRKGSPNGGRIPEGYYRTHHREKGRKVVKQHLDPDAAERVRYVFHALVDGESISKVAAETGWSTSRIRKMVKNVAYLGKRKRKDMPFTEATWPAIVDRDTFDAANEVLKRNLSGWKPGRLQHWLSGAVECGCTNPDHKHEDARQPCGMGLVCVPMRGSPDRYVYSCPKPGCTAIAADKAEQHIFDRIVKMFADPNFRHNLFHQAAAGNDEAEALSKEVDELQERKRNLERRLTAENEDITDSILSSIREVNSQIRAKEQQRLRVGSPPSLRVLFGGADWDPDTNTLTLPDAAQDIWTEDHARGFEFAQRWHDLSIPSRRGVVRDLMTVKLHPVGRGKRVPIEQQLTVVPRYGPEQARKPA